MKSLRPPAELLLFMTKVLVGLVMLSPRKHVEAVLFLSLPSVIKITHIVLDFCQKFPNSNEFKSVKMPQMENKRNVT